MSIQTFSRKFFFSFLTFFIIFFHEKNIKIFPVSKKILTGIYFGIDISTLSKTDIFPKDQRDFRAPFPTTK